MQPNQSVSKRPREEDNVQEQNLTISEILNSYANANSEDDSDFVPNPEDEIESSTSSESDSESRSSEEISSSEVLDNAEEVGQQFKVASKKPFITNLHSRSISVTKSCCTPINLNERSLWRRSRSRRRSWTRQRLCRQPAMAATTSTATARSRRKLVMDIELLLDSLSLSHLPRHLSSSFRLTESIDYRFKRRSN